MKKIIEVKNLNSACHENLNWSLYQNEFHGLIGPSGMGKSCFLKILLDLFPYSSGEITDELGEKWNYKNHLVGIQFQSNGLLNNLTIGENIMMPLIMKLNMPKKYATFIALEYMEKVGLSCEFFNYFPLECSGGMQKRAALARALVLEPRFLFLDEPTAGIDCMLLETFDSLLNSLENVSIVMVTHDLSRLARIADRISILVDKKFFTGTMEDLKNHSNHKVRDFIYSYINTTVAI